MCCGSAPPAPDYSQIAAANAEGAKYAKQAADNDLAFRKQVYADSLPRQQQLYELASQVAQQQLGIGNFNQQMAEQQWKQYQGMYAPNERLSMLDAYGGQYLGDEDIQQALGFMDQRYNTVTEQRTREVPGTTPASPTRTMDSFMAELRSSGRYNVPGQRVEQGRPMEIPMEGGNQIIYVFPDGSSSDVPVRVVGSNSVDEAGLRAEAQRLFSAQQQPTAPTTETYEVSRQVLDEDWEKQRTAGLYGLARKAQTAAGDQAAMRAGADINSAFAQQGRALQRMGGDPTRMAAFAAKLGNQQALAKVGASNQAREAVRGQQLGLRSGTANFGRNMPNTAGQAFGLATQAGSSATANQNQGFMSGLPYAQFQSGGTTNQLGAAGLGIQSNLGLGGLMNSSYTAQMNNSGGTMGALLGIGNMAANMYGAGMFRG